MGVESCIVVFLGDDFLFTSDICCRMYGLDANYKKLTGTKSRLQFRTINGK